MKKLYLDLDGVLADFDGRVRELAKLSGITLSSMSKSQMWKMIYRDRDFFLNLNFIKEAKDLWEYAKQFNPTILTGLPSRMEGKEHKIQWVKNTLGDYKTIVVPKIEKQKYAAQNCVLVDDHPSNIEQWIAKGGIGILHPKMLVTDTVTIPAEGAYAKTLAALKRVMEA